MSDRTQERPFTDEEATGRKFVFPCCTGALHEFKREGTLFVASSVAGHGWGQPWECDLMEHNDDGWLVLADGTEIRKHWHPEGRDLGQ